VWVRGIVRVAKGMGTGCHTGKPPTPAARVVGKGVQHGGHHTPLQVQPSQEVVIVNGRTTMSSYGMPTSCQRYPTSCPFISHRSVGHRTSPSFPHQMSTHECCYGADVSKLDEAALTACSPQAGKHEVKTQPAVVWMLSSGAVCLFTNQIDN
jgi:hypothetical protein